MSGGKKTSKSSGEGSQYIDPTLKQRGDDLYALGNLISTLGFQPNKGVTVAGFTPMQEAAMQNVSNQASAFGMQTPANPMAGMPAAETNAQGIKGYSTGQSYDDMMASLPPAYRDAINSLFMDPQTGAAPTGRPYYVDSTQGGVSADHFGNPGQMLYNSPTMGVQPVGGFAGFKPYSPQ